MKTEARTPKDAAQSFDPIACRFGLPSILAALLVVLALPSVGRAGVASSEAAIYPKAILEKARPALAVLVSADRRGKAKSYGTGFFISADGLLVTARHVAQAQDHLVAITQDGKGHRVTGFLGEDRDYDVAVLKVDGTGFSHLPLAETPLPQTNQWVAVVSPTDQWTGLFSRTNANPAIATGRVATVLDLLGLWTLITTTVPTQRGQSGSPMLDETGVVVGIVASNSGQEQGNASPTTIIRHLVTQAGSDGPVPFSKRPRKGNHLPLWFDADFRAGVIAFQQQDWKAVEHRMKRAARNFPESPIPLTCRGLACVKRELWQDARTVFQRALRLRPDNGMIRVLHGTSLVALGRAEGMAEVRKGIELGLPNRATLISTWALLATVETALGHQDQARVALAILDRLDSAEAAALRDQLKQVETTPANREATRKP